MLKRYRNIQYKVNNIREFLTISGISGVIARLTFKLVRGVNAVNGNIPFLNYYKYRDH